MFLSLTADPKIAVVPSSGNNNSSNSTGISLKLWILTCSAGLRKRFGPTSTNSVCHQLVQLLSRTPQLTFLIPATDVCVSNDFVNVNRLHVSTLASCAHCTEEIQKLHICHLPFPRTRTTRAHVPVLILTMKSFRPSKHFAR